MKIQKTYILLFLSIVMLLSYSCNIEESNSTKTDEKEVFDEFNRIWAFFNNEDLSDSSIFNQYIAFHAEDYVIVGEKGNSLSTGEQQFEWLYGFLKTHKPKFDITIDKIEVSNNLAYVLFHFHEEYSRIDTGEKIVDAKHSAIYIMRKDEERNWKCVLFKSF